MNDKTRLSYKGDIMSRINVLKFHDFFVIRKDSDNNYFICNEDTFIISIFNLSSLLKFMLFKGILSPKVLEGILSEYYN